MASLGEFPSVRKRIRDASTRRIEALHKFIFEGDLLNRDRLRLFKGFEYDENDDSYKKKVAYVKDNLTTTELRSICNILGISYDSELILLIFSQLKKGALLNARNKDANSDKDEAACGGVDKQRKDQRKIIRLAQGNEHFAVKKVPCILNNKKLGKQKSELNPLNKVDVPLHTYHICHLLPRDSTSKKYKHIFVVIDAFTKFCWLYPTKSTTTSGVIANLKSQSIIFGNPVQIISHTGTSEDFRNYCQAENIKHLITTGLPRAEAESLNFIKLSVLNKLSASRDPAKWYKYVGKVQQEINSTYSMHIGTTPFNRLIGTQMRKSVQCISQFNVEREQTRQIAEEDNAKMQ